MTRLNSARSQLDARAQQQAVVLSRQLAKPCLQRCDERNGWCSLQTNRRRLIEESPNSSRCPADSEAWIKVDPSLLNEIRPESKSRSSVPASSSPLYVPHR